MITLCSERKYSYKSEILVNDQLFVGFFFSNDKTGFFLIPLTKSFIILNATEAFMPKHNLIAQSSADIQDFEIQPREAQAVLLTS